MADIMKMGQNPDYLGSWDIEDLPGKEVTLTIEKIVDEEVIAAGQGGQKEVCTVCHWTDKNFKKMILNITNKKALCKLYKTKDTEQLKGQAVVIGIEKVKAFGDIHDALRIRKRMPTKTEAPAQKCEDCGKDIAPSNNMTSAQVASYTKKKYGKCLCAECATAAAKAVQE